MRIPLAWFERSTRVTAAAIALCSVSTLLPVVGTSPAYAANISVEMLVDPTDSSVRDDLGGVREFAGRDRYVTALQLAQRYAHEQGGLGSVTTVIVASGESPIDGAVAASLASHHAAPILLTPPGGLPEFVGGFIEDHGVTQVIVVGGLSSVSAAVLDQITALDPSPAVRRIAGEDRFATAVAIASELDGLAAWCGTDENAALLANGSDHLLGYLVGAGPLAHRLEMPMLLTHSGVLPSSTSNFLRERDIDRVVILGGTNIVGATVLEQLGTAGVNVIERIGGTSAAATAAAVAKVMTGDCESVLDTADDIAALISVGSAVDAVAAAPMLATGIDGSGPIPLLFAATAVPAGTRSFLAATPRAVDGRKTQFSLVAIGGPQSVTQAMMLSALKSASTSRALISQITATADEAEIRVRFSEALNVDGAQFGELMRDLLHVNGIPAWIVSQELLSPVGEGACDALSTLVVTVRHPVVAGDIVEFRTAQKWFSTDGDRRPLVGSVLTVPTPTETVSLPQIDVVALSGRSQITMAVSGDAVLDENGSLIDGVTLIPDQIRVASQRDVDVEISEPRFVDVDRFFGVAIYELDLIAPQGAAATAAHEAIAPGGAYRLTIGDVIHMRGGVAVDAENQRSGRRISRVTGNDTSFGVSAVRIGRANPGVDDSETTAKPGEIQGVSRKATASLADAVRITGKWSGSAAGAAGNGWEIDSGRAPASRGETASAASRTNHDGVRVWIDTAQRVVLVRFIDPPEGVERELTHVELVDALNSNAAFRRHFDAQLADGCGEGDELVSLDPDDGFVGTTTLTTPLIDGMSSVSFLVTFSDLVDEFVSDDRTDIADAGNAGAVVELVDDVLGSLIEDYADTAFGNAKGESLDVSTRLPHDKVFFRFTTSDPERIPVATVSGRRILINIAAGIAKSFHTDDPATVEVDESVNPARALFAVTGRDPVLLAGFPATSE